MLLGQAFGKVLLSRDGIVVVWVQCHRLYSSDQGGEGCELKTAKSDLELWMPRSRARSHSLVQRIYGLKVLRLTFFSTTVGLLERDGHAHAQTLAARAPTYASQLAAQDCEMEYGVHVSIFNDLSAVLHAEYLLSI